MQGDHDVVSCYSRAQALSDGFLVDVTEAARRIGFRAPLAITEGVWRDCVAWDTHTSRVMKTYQDEAARLAALLQAAMSAVRDAMRRDDNSPQTFAFNRVAPSGTVRSASRTTAIIELHGGDNGEMVWTIMASEDR
ncbi:DUF6573 family protein [Xanthomonas perforans]|uniref:DUF6573 family protein n=1 Tax=Xanthomonas perforans TaxID=442694 RepID=UPI002B36508F|nr:DUF6573 family protein [Xanthomonas campestris pv. campestris]